MVWQIQEINYEAYFPFFKEPHVVFFMDLELRGRDFWLHKTLKNDLVNIKAEIKNGN